MTARRKFLYLSRRVGVLIGRVFWDEPPSKDMLLHADNVPVVWSTELTGEDLERSIEELIVGYLEIEAQSGAPPASNMAEKPKPAERKEERKVGYRENPTRSGMLSADTRPALDQLADILGGSRRKLPCHDGTCRRADGIRCREDECAIASGLAPWPRPVLATRAGPPTPRAA